MTAGNMLLSPGVTHQQERKILVLDALTKLADQFARDPDLQHLVDSIVLTVAGQFAVTSAMLITRSNNLDIRGSIRSSTGKFRGLSVSADFLHTGPDISECTSDPGPCHLDDPRLNGSECAVLHEWHEMGARIFVPLVINGSTAGVMLLGSRVGNLQFSEDDLELLQHFIATITPLLANSLLYADVAALSARHLQILDSVRQAIYVFDSGGSLLMANRAADELTYVITGGAAATLPAGTVIESAFPEEVFPGWAEQLRNVRFQQNNRLPSTLIAKGKDGERVFSVGICPRVGLSSLEDGMILTLDDKTELTNNERRMFELEKFADQGVMASSISHELNNHLGMILGGVDLALMAQEKGNHARVSTTLAKLRESVTRMERFTAGLMDYGRINTQKQATLINDVVSDVISFAAAQKRFRFVKLNTDLASDLPQLQMDRDQIAQVIINILNNAADAITETGRRDGIIIVSTGLNDGEMTLSVSDNGRGMTPEVKEKLFKAHLTTKPKGHGYGLTTCAKILEHHGAKISIESQVGFGTTFSFRFPVS
jgi:signal transduction histidine kinase